MAKGGGRRLRKNPSHRHPEEAKPVLSETREGPPHLLENSNTGVLRFAQDDSTEEFFRSLFSRAAWTRRDSLPARLGRGHTLRQRAVL